MVDLFLFKLRQLFAVIIHCLWLFAIGDLTAFQAAWLVRDCERKGLCKASVPEPFYS